MEEKIEELLDALRKCAKENPNLFDYEQIYKCYLKQAKRVEKDEEYGWPNYIIADYYTENNNKKYAIEVRSCVDHFGYVGTIDGTVSVCIYEYDNSEWVEGSNFFDYGDIACDAPAAIFELSPTLTGPSTLAPAPIITLFPMVGCLLPHSLPVPPRVEP